jgi:hypothetical protein
MNSPSVGRIERPFDAALASERPIAQTGLRGLFIPLTLPVPRRDTIEAFPET